MALIQLITPKSIKQTRDPHRVLFDWLREITNYEEAINASSWAEIADIGEEYEGDSFKLRIIG